MVTPVLAVVLTIASASQSSGAKVLPSSYLQFSAEDEGVKNAVPIPDAVWALLKQDSDVREVMQNEHLEVPPSTWFSAAVVHLHRASRNDLVVQAEGKMMGANVTEFWVLAETSHGPNLLLKVPAHDLEIRDIDSSGYKTIEASAIIAGHECTLTYKFKGSKYALYRRSSY